MTSYILMQTRMLNSIVSHLHQATQNSPVTGWGSLSEISNVNMSIRCQESINYVIWQKMSNVQKVKHHDYG